MEEFFTIIEKEEAEIVEKKSKFIAEIYCVTDVEDAENKIKSIKKKYHDAKHHCIAYRVIQDGRIVEKSSDDGEPSGTAGAPMLNLLQANKLCNVVVVVTRYFGGILLGTGGLVRAYSDVTKLVINKCKLVCKVDGVELIVEMDYSNLESFKYYCRKNEINILNVEYSENIKIKIEMDKNKRDLFVKDIDVKNVNIIRIVETCNKMVNKVVNK